MAENIDVIPFPSTNVECASCGSQSTATHMEEESFQYGEADATVMLIANVPVHTCEECGFEFTNKTADAIRHDSVCRHLRVMTPTEISKIREGFGFSKAEFARQTGIGEASINRWERGAIIQNAAMDSYLYLLSLRGNLQALRERGHTTHTRSLTQEFQSLVVTEEMKTRSNSFKL